MNKKLQDFMTTKILTCHETILGQKLARYDIKVCYNSSISNRKPAKILTQYNYYPEQKDSIQNNF
jgi:hypothetical protein